MTQRQQPDVPRCVGLRPGMPCPFPDDCDCERIYRMSDMTENKITGIVVACLVLAFLVSMFALFMSIARGADVDPACLTKSQARAKFKTQHLYWHTVNHCWDNRSGRGAPFAPTTPPAPRQAAPRPVHDVSRETLIAYPTLMAGLGTDAVMLKPGAMTSWPLLDEPREFTPWQERIDLPALGGKPD